MDRRFFGEKIRRVEDPKLITGQGRYVDDLNMPGLLHAVFVRSSHAHAFITSVDCRAALDIPGVVRIFQAKDFGENGRRRMPHMMPVANIFQPINYQPLADQEVAHVGEAIIVIVAESRATAEDAAALIDIEYQLLPAVVDWKTALNADAPRAHSSSSDNLVATLKAQFGPVDEIFKSAPHVFSETILTHRGGCHSMECRGVLASEDQFNGNLSVWTSSQVPHVVRRLLALHLGRSEHTVQVIAPDVGGGFGPKAIVYPEEVVICLAAIELKRPVKWIEDRSEHFVATAQLRDQLWNVDVAAAADGRMMGIRGRCIHDHGAYVPYGLVAAVTATSSFPGPYALDALDIRLDVVFTNLVPTAPVRGAGRPNAAFVLERLADRIARELRIDPAEVRRRSFVKEFPYATGIKARDGSPVSYDSGDYLGCMEAALAKAGDNFKARQAAALAGGRYLGRGIASYVEDTGLAPFEGATVSIEPNGTALIRTGASSQGQGHATIFAQICADVLGIGIEKIEVQGGNTGVFAQGIGAIASRTAVTAGSSVYQAAMLVRDKAIKYASEKFEVSEADLIIVDGKAQIVGIEQMSISLGQIASELTGISGWPIAKGFEPGLSATSHFDVRRNTYAHGTHVVEVEVDIETGQTAIKRYVVAHDCGKLINPMLVDGQVRGGVVHGIGNALFERMLHDEAGQPITTNYADYLLTTAPETPRIEIVHLETPSPLNPIGVKGAGEGGTIPTAACIIAAIEDALSPLNVHLAEHPISPARLRHLIREKEDAMAGRKPGSWLTSMSK
jgi:aerobic carbon-monoxide dehydrogenase large subunit